MEVDEDEPHLPPPKPMWANRKPKPPPEPEGEEDHVPPPKPMWANRKPKGAETVDTPPRPPMQMWGNRAPSCSEVVPAGGSTTTIGAETSHEVTQYRNVEIDLIDGEGSTPVQLTPASEGRVGSSVEGTKPKKYIKQYEMGMTLGKGSYAKVKVCINTDNGQTLAVKIFNKSLLKKRKMWDSTQGTFKTALDDVFMEIAIMKKLSHDNVMNMYDVIDDPAVGKLYMVMDFCRSGAIMESSALPCAPLEQWKCHSWFADSVIGLEYLHYQGVVHFDLKPDNILVTDDNRAIISDFGVSRVLGSSGDEEAHSLAEEEKAKGLTRGSPGTPSYTAPEVWGARAYHGKTADVWSLGVTLHAMVFGTLPYFALDQQELIKMVTAPEPWNLDAASLILDKGERVAPDKQLVDLLGKLMHKNPEDRISLEQVKHHPWIQPELGSRKRVSIDEYTKIEVNARELREAVISGHVANFRRNVERGTLSKLTPASEGARYRELLNAQDGVGRFLPNLADVKQSTGRRVILEMEDLTHNVQGACLMDIKMGTRTFTEEDVASNSVRPDLLDKMRKLDPSAVTPEDIAAGGITKHRYLQFREGSTTSEKLGFRIDAVQLSADAPQAGMVPDAEELRSSINTVEQVRDTIMKYVQQRPHLLTSFLEQMREMRGVLEGCKVFAAHEFVRTSILLVYSNATNSTTCHIIDLTRVSEIMGGALIDHRAKWQPGNHEDGYLFGLDNLIKTFEECLTAIQ